MSYIKRVNFNTLNFEKHRIGEDTNINKCLRGSKFNVESCQCEGMYLSMLILLSHLF